MDLKIFLYKGRDIMKILNKNQLTIFVIALMFVAAGYLSYTTKDNTKEVGVAPEEKLAAIGDAALVNSGEIIEKDDKQSILNNINETSKTDNKENNSENSTINTNNDNSNTTANTSSENNTTSTNTSNDKNNDNMNNTNENNSSIPTASNNLDNYFANSRLERETMYSQMLETYQRILESNTVSQEQKAISGQEINKINQTKNGIMIAENLIKTKGFSDVIIFVNDNSVSVITQAGELSAEEIAQIQNIVSRELKVEIENIHISKR